ncbi:MAG: hypothetical protein HFJ53_03025 [Clostridia bacterium]|jgi:hypothetical protein|nr:hypothetical protein [Clostridia bacterium]
MIFVLGNKDLLLKSKYYKPENNWDYPLEELDHVINENTDNDMIYVVADDKRIYETSCKRENLLKLYKDLNQEIKLRDFEMAALSVSIKYYVKAGIDVAKAKLNKWQEEMSNYNPNIDEILKDFKIIIEPIETYRNSKRKFDVRLTEKASTVVTIEATSKEEALENAMQQYNDREITFDYEDYEEIDVKATEKIDINVPEVSLSGNLYFSFDGIRDWEKLKKSNIKDLESDGELITMQMDKVDENPLNVALISEEGRLYLISYLYDNKECKTDNLTSDPINDEIMKSEESLKDYMMNYFINVYVENMDLINNFYNQEEEEEM